MVGNKHLTMLSLMACSLLIACASPIKKTTAFDMYQLPTAAPAAGQPTRIDNDSYYTQPYTYQPGAYHGCNQINDAPSCGGG